MEQLLAVISISSIMFAMFNLGRAYEVMQDLKQITAEGMQK